MLLIVAKRKRDETEEGAGRHVSMSKQVLLTTNRWKCNIPDLKIGAIAGFDK